MICYKDRTFCYRKCGNRDCQMNKANIDWKHVEEIGLPVSFTRNRDCERWTDDSRRNDSV